LKVQTKKNILISHAIDAINNFFPSEEYNITIDDNEASIKNFVAKATSLKSFFTNDSFTLQLLEDCIREKYSFADEYDIYYDLPRLRVIPNSNIINTGISYNYLPHRDTWYGSGQGQINHWISVMNVTKNSTFYIAQKYFAVPIDNSSSNFDLDVWDKVYRPAASLSMKNEERPHPKPLNSIPEADKEAIVLDPGEEVVFSTQQLHGSCKNTTDKTRFSIDYRVHMPRFENIYPVNVDCLATGNYYKYLKKL
jgi:hypothetical protein